MKYYFAYGSNMDFEQMLFRCPDARPVERAILYGYRFIINARGVATIVRDPENLVMGLVWKLGEDDEAALDLYEGVRGGYYGKSNATVEALSSDRVYDCLVYVASENRPGCPREGYLETIIDACRKFQFPARYTATLEKLLAGKKG